MTNVVLLAAWMAAAMPAQEQEKRIPNDSVEVSSRGCIKGRVFAAGPLTPEDEGRGSGPTSPARASAWPDRAKPWTR